MASIKKKVDGTIIAFDKVFNNYMMRAQVKEWHQVLAEMEKRRNIEMPKIEEKKNQS